VPLDYWNRKETRLAVYCKNTWLDHVRAAEPISRPVLEVILIYFGTNFHSWADKRPRSETKQSQQHGGPLTAKLRYRRLLQNACKTGLPSFVHLVLETEFSACPVRKRTRDFVQAAPLKHYLLFATILAIGIAAFLYCSYHLWASSRRVNFVILSSLLIAQLWVFWHIAVESHRLKMSESDEPLQLAAEIGSVPIVQAC
jgi:hypothetical protein